MDQLHSQHSHRTWNSVGTRKKFRILGLCRLLISSTVKFKEDLNLMFQPQHQTTVSYSKFFRSHPGFAGHPTATPRALSQGNLRVVAAIRWHPSIKVLNKYPKCPNFSLFLHIQHIPTSGGALFRFFSGDFLVMFRHGSDQGPPNECRTHSRPHLRPLDPGSCWFFVIRVHHQYCGWKTSCSPWMVETCWKPIKSYKLWWDKPSINL